MAKTKRESPLGRYILGKTLGEGTFGKVKVGTHLLTGEKLAVKILERARIKEVSDVERVARELHILKIIKHHPHIIQLLEIIETEEELYLMMEHCSGGELFEHIVVEGRLEEAKACRFFHQIVSGVDHMHRVNVVHRDLKPENMLLDENKNIKIVDFGLSNVFMDGELLKTACGSPCYAAPEMIADKWYHPPGVDIWSCGVIVFALICGYLPFEDPSHDRLYRSILNADYTIPKFASDTARNFIGKILTIDPDKRATIRTVREHAWYKQIPEASVCLIEHHKGREAMQTSVVELVQNFGFSRGYVKECLKSECHNEATTTYHLLAERQRRALASARDEQRHGEVKARRRPRGRRQRGYDGFAAG